jgi:hypothetical protein
MAYPLFDTRTMLAALEQRKPPRTFLLDTFFKNSNVSNSEYIDIDIMKGKRRMAPFVNPRREGKLVEKIGYKTYSYKPPYIKPKMVTTAEDILKKAMGTQIYTPNQGPAQKAAEELGKNLRELDEMITRREEWMAAQVLTTGQVDVKGDGVDENIDFLMEVSHLPVLTGTALWSDSTNAKPLDNLRTWRRRVAQDSGIVPTDVIMGTDALEALLACDQIIGSTGGRKGLFDIRRINIGQLDPKTLPNGVIYYGTITELQLDLWTYDEWYVDEWDNETEKPMMPTDKVLMGSPNARTQRQYGAIQDLDNTVPVARFPKSWTEKDPSARFVMLQSAPLPSLHQVDAFLCATVL